MSKIITQYLGDAEGFTNGVQYCPTMPAVTYQPRFDGQATRIEREGKADHVTLVRSNGIELVVASGRGVVGLVGWSRYADEYVVERFADHHTTFHGRDRAHAIAEAARTWIL